MKPNHHLKYNLIHFAILCAAFGLCSCKREAIHFATHTPFDSSLQIPISQDTPNSIMDFFTSDRHHYSVFLLALKRTGINSLLKKKGHFFVFVADNEAFDQVGITVGNVESVNINELRDLLQQQIIRDDIELIGNHASMGKDSIYCVETANGTYANGQMLSNIWRATNGIISETKMLFTTPAQNAWQFIAADPACSFFAAALQRSDYKSKKLSALLELPEIHTLFVPTDNAFRAAGIFSADDINHLDPDSLSIAMAGYIIPMRYFYGQRSNGDPDTISLPTLGSAKIQIYTDPFGGPSGFWSDSFIVTNTQPQIGITDFNIMVSNGIVHKIISLILP